MPTIKNTLTKLQRKWLTALLSDNYGQTKNKLRSIKDKAERFCCLGVACEVSSLGHWCSATYITHGLESDSSSMALPRVVARALHTDSCCSVIDPYDGYWSIDREILDQLALTNLNDEVSLSFRMIATLVALHPDWYFHNFEKGHTLTYRQRRNLGITEKDEKDLLKEICSMFEDESELLRRNLQACIDK